MHIRKIVLLIALASGFSCEKENTGRGPLELVRVFIGTTEINLEGPVSDNLPTDRTITIIFSSAVNQTAAANAITLTKDGQPVAMDISFISSGTTAVVHPAGLLASNTIYTVSLSDQLQGTNGETFVPREISFKTAIGSLQITSVEIGGTDIEGVSRIIDVPLDLAMTIHFSAPVKESSLGSASELVRSECSRIGILIFQQ